MRDVRLLAATLRLIRDGGGTAQQMLNLHGECWYTGPVALNGQAVSDLIADGWLTCPADRQQAVIDAWPAFASQTEVQALAKSVAQKLRDLRTAAEEYAELSRDFPLSGAGSLFTFLDDLERLVAAEGSDSDSD